MPAYTRHANYDRVDICPGLGLKFQTLRLACTPYALLMTWPMSSLAQSFAIASTSSHPLTIVTSVHRIFQSRNLDQGLWRCSVSLGETFTSG